jgi:hypothetical protein
LKEPIPEIFHAAKKLNEAVMAHLSKDYSSAERLFLETNLNEIREWTESIWGSSGIYYNLVSSLGTPITIEKELRDIIRMPTKEEEQFLIKRDGFFCRFCGIPLIRKEVRVALNKMYPNAIPWGRKNGDQHAAFQAMWMQFDHVIPHARGGKTNLENMIVSCAPCNYGRMNFLMEEVGIILSQSKRNHIENWEGLEKVFKK